LSISGIQIKHSLKLEEKKLILTETGGAYILKPTPMASFLNLDYTPANEHLTMQLAGQIFISIRTQRFHAVSGQSARLYSKAI